MNENLVPLGFAQVTDLSSAAHLPAIGSPSAIPQGANYGAVIAATGKDVVWRDDGTAPTASVGIPLAVGDTLNYWGDLTKIQFIQTAASATLNVSYYKAVG